MSWTVNVTITKKQWLDHPEDRWNAGLDKAGFNFRQGLQRSHYPPLPPSGDHRNYTTADKADYNITEPGKRMEFGSTFYLPFLLNGTRFMQGWPGMGQSLRDLLEAGFKAGIKDYSG